MLSMCSEISGLTSVCTLLAVWPKSLSWTNSQAKVSTNFELSHVMKESGRANPFDTRLVMASSSSIYE